MPLWWKNFSASHGIGEKNGIEPVDELRIAPLARHAVGVAVDFFHALERVASQVDPSGRIQLLQLSAYSGSPTMYSAIRPKIGECSRGCARRLIW